MMDNVETLLPLACVAAYTENERYFTINSTKFSLCCIVHHAHELIKKKNYSGTLTSLLNFS